MSEINGRFYFKQTVNGNLIGEFSNDKSDIVTTESADITPHSNRTGFIGTFNSSWQEDENPYYCQLEISRKNGTSLALYSLVWRRDKETVFKGEGMFCDNILLGNYWSVK